MKRISVIITTIAFIVTMLPCVSEQAPTTRAPRVGKPLVKRLPAKVQGVKLIGGTVRAKSGFKFVKRRNGSVTVARMAGGGLGVGGTWNCSCEPIAPPPPPPAPAPTPGTCQASISGPFLTCTQGTCTGTCQLAVVVEGLRTGVLAF
jgi:hypothetical protein